MSALNEISHWGAAEFLQAVQQREPKVAVFDCDGTLWSGDSGSGFMLWSIQQGLLSRAMCDWIDDRYRAYKAGQVSELAICGEMVQIYAGVSEGEMREAAARYVHDAVTPWIFPELAELVKRLQHAGTQLWAVSSTNKWVVVEGLRSFGIPAERVLAAEVRVANGELTHELIDVPTDEGKANALKRVGLNRPDAVFGNSIHDLAMLKLAQDAYPVNASPALAHTAIELGWRCYFPAGTAKPFDHIGDE